MPLNEISVRIQLFGSIAFDTSEQGSHGPFETNLTQSPMFGRHQERQHSLHLTHTITSNQDPQG